MGDLSEAVSESFSVPAFLQRAAIDGRRHQESP